MTNKRAANELETNFRRFWRLWRYATARGLSFARRYWNKLTACLQALSLALGTYTMTERVLDALTWAPMEVL